MASVVPPCSHRLVRRGASAPAVVSPGLARSAGPTRCSTPAPTGRLVSLGRRAEPGAVAPLADARWARLHEAASAGPIDARTVDMQR
jgi:hypothetical protein